MIENKVTTRFISQGDFPNDKQYVVGKLKNQLWTDNADTQGNRFFVVVRFERGLSSDERNALKDNDLRKKLFKSCDEGGNNQKGYGWSAFGTAYYFGQEIDAWFALDEISLGEMNV